MKKILTVLVLIITVALAFSSGVYAQTQSVTPVKWRTIVKQTGPGEGVVTFRAIVAPGWHLYGMAMPDNGPKPTTFDLTTSTDMKFTGAVVPSRNATRSLDPLFSAELEWWDSNVEFTVPFTVTGSAPVLRCVIGYMACDGTTCRPPSRETVTTPIKLK